MIQRASETRANIAILAHARSVSWNHKTPRV